MDTNTIGILWGVAALIVGIVVSVRNYIRKKEKKQEAIELREAEKKRLIEKYPKFEKFISDDNKTIEQGMNYELLLFLLGRPQDTKEQILKEKKKLNCFYGGYRTSKGTIKYSLRIDLENDEIIGWKQL
jgi:hypothetical protein